MHVVSRWTSVCRHQCRTHFELLCWYFFSGESVGMFSVPSGIRLRLDHLKTKYLPVRFLFSRNPDQLHLVRCWLVFGLFRSLWMRLVCCWRIFAFRVCLVFCMSTRHVPITRCCFDVFGLPFQSDSSCSWSNDVCHFSC